MGVFTGFEYNSPHINVLVHLFFDAYSAFNFEIILLTCVVSNF